MRKGGQCACSNRFRHIPANRVTSAPLFLGRNGWWCAETATDCPCKASNSPILTLMCGSAAGYMQTNRSRALTTEGTSETRGGELRQTIHWSVDSAVHIKTTWTISSSSYHRFSTAGNSRLCEQKEFLKTDSVTRQQKHRRHAAPHLSHHEKYGKRGSPLNTWQRSENTMFWRAAEVPHSTYWSIILTAWLVQSHTQPEPCTDRRSEQKPIDRWCTVIYLQNVI